MKLTPEVTSLLSNDYRDSAITAPESNLAQAREWLRAHPSAHKSYRQVSLNDQLVWVDDAGIPVRRDVTRERQQIKDYLTTVKHDNPDYYKKLKQYQETLAPMDASTRVAVNIPAWREEANLYKLLDEYTRQIGYDGEPISADLYEMNILVNRKVGEVPDGSIAEIQRFLASARNQQYKYRINYIDVEFQPPYNNVGQARKMVSDVTLLRSLARKHQDGPLYFATEDADLLRVGPRAVINIISHLDLNPELGAVMGKEGRCFEILVQNDLLFLNRRLSDIKTELMQKKRYRVARNLNGDFMWNRVYSNGWNLGMSAESYALIGGYDPLMLWGEDLAIGLRMSMARGNGLFPNEDVVGIGFTLTDSSPRRMIATMASGIDPHTSANFMDPATNDDIRNESIDQLLTRITDYAQITDQNLPVFSKLINTFAEGLVKHAPSRQEADKLIRLAMALVGFARDDYTIEEEGEIHIHAIHTIKSAIARHRRFYQSRIHDRYRAVPLQRSFRSSNFNDEAIADQLLAFTPKRLHTRQAIAEIAPEIIGQAITRHENKQVLALDMGGQKVAEILYEIKRGVLHPQSTTVLKSTHGKGYFEFITNSAARAIRHKAQVGISYPSVIRGTKPESAGQITDFFTDLHIKHNGDMANLFPGLQPCYNDAVAGTLASIHHLHTLNPNVKNILFVINGSGVGGAIYKDGSIYSMEPGHIALNHELNIFGVDTPCSLDEERRTCIANAIGGRSGIESLWQTVTGKHMDTRDINTLYKQGDLIADYLFKYSAEVLTLLIQGIAAAHDLLNPSDKTAIVLHGGLFGSYEYAQRVKWLLQGNLLEAPAVYLSSDFSENACAEGAALAALLAK